MNPTATEYGLWMLVFGQLVATVSGVVAIVMNFRSQKRQVSLTDDFATLPQVEKVERVLGARIDVVDHEVKKLRGDIVTNGEVRRQSIEAKVEAVRKEVQSDVRAVDDKVCELTASVGGIETNCKLTNAHLVQLDNKITTVLERRNH